jgi:hypothetical protein
MAPYRSHARHIRETVPLVLCQRKDKEWFRKSRRTRTTLPMSSIFGGKIATTPSISAESAAEPHKEARPNDGGTKYEDPESLVVGRIASKGWMTNVASRERSIRSKSAFGNEDISIETLYK